MLSINAARGAIRIGFIGETIQHLDLVTTHEKDAAVAAALAISMWRRRFAEFKVQLDIPE